MSCLRPCLFHNHLASGLAAISLACCSISASAFQPLVTDDTGTQGSGGNQIEFAATNVKETGGKASDTGFAFTRGVTDAIDVFVELGRQKIEPDGAADVSGPTNTAIGAKWRFYENERKTSLAVKPIYLHPLSQQDEAEGLGTGKASLELSLILTQEMEWGAVHANLVRGSNRFRDSAVDEDVTQFSVAPVWNFNENLKLAVDLGTTRTEIAGGSATTRFGELGAIYSPNADLDFALGFIREKDKDMSETTKVATAGVTWRFK